MKTSFKTLSLAVLAVSIMAASPVLADMGGAKKPDETHQAIHQTTHGNDSSSMMGGSMMGSHHGMMANNMGNHHGMSAIMNGGLGNANCLDANQSDRDLSVDDVRNILEGHLVWRGNKRLKVGKVEASEDETYIAEILTVDNSLVEQISVDKNTGAMTRK